MIDLEPATRTLTNLIHRVRDQQLGNSTPCQEISLGDLIDHVEGLAAAFTLAATKSVPPGGSAGPSADGSRLGADFRVRIAKGLAGLAQAWDRPDAWEGMTKVGGQQLPGSVAGVVALNEVVVHSWDIAVASGQEFACKPALVEAALGFVQPTAEQHPGGVPGLFGPAVAVPPAAPLLARLLGLTGRDPNWRPTPLPG